MRRSNLDSEKVIDDLIGAIERSHGMSPVDKHKNETSYSFVFTNKQIFMIKAILSANTSNYFLKKLQEYSFEKYDESGARIAYTDIRKYILTCSIMLNFKGEIAPRFRHMRKPIRPGIGRSYPIEHSLLSNDRQVIDLHWIQCQKLQANEINGYKGLFDVDKPFDFEKASVFVNKAGSLARKSELLGLSELEQFQLASIESTAVKTRWNTIRSNCDKNQSALKDLFSSSRSRFSPEKLKHIPDIHKSILIARGSASNALKIFRLMTGLSEEYKTFQRHVTRFKEAKLLI
jgi:hypothetical protein